MAKSAKQKRASEPKPGPLETVGTQVRFIGPDYSKLASKSLLGKVGHIVKLGGRFRAVGDHYKQLVCVKFPCCSHDIKQLAEARTTRGKCGSLGHWLDTERLEVVQ